MKGQIKKELLVDCGVCMSTQDLFSKTVAEAAEEAESMGWKHTRKNGWVCPECSNEGRG